MAWSPVWIMFVQAILPQKTISVVELSEYITSYFRIELYEEFEERVLTAAKYD